MLTKLALSILCLSILVGLSGCQIYYGAKVYDVTASTEEGKRYIEKYQVRYVCQEAFGIFYTDIIRSKDGVYAIHVKKDTFSNKIQYIPINKNYAERLGLKPDFSFWDTYGRIGFFIIIGIAAIGGGFLAYHQHIERIETGHEFDKKRSEMIPLLAYPFDFDKGFKEIILEGKRVKVKLNSAWKDYQKLTLRNYLNKDVCLQLIRLYDRNRLIHTFKHGIYRIPLTKSTIIKQLSSDCKKLLFEGKIDWKAPIDMAHVYTSLLDIKGGDLDSTSWLFAEHLDIGKVPINFNRNLSVPGISIVMKLDFQILSKIEISIEYANDIKALAAIISHEYAHIFRILHKFTDDSKEKEEILTDISTILLGFDDLILQGLSSIKPVGYLTPSVVAEFCEIIDTIRKTNAYDSIETEVSPLDVEEHLKSIRHILPDIGELQESLNDADKVTRLWAVQELRRIDGKESLSILEKTLYDEDEDVRNAAKEAIHTIKKNEGNEGKGFSCT